MSEQASLKPRKRRINWPHVSTVISAAILIGAEVFGAAYAGGWAIGLLLGLGTYGTYALQAVFFLGGALLMAAFFRMAITAEPFFIESQSEDQQHAQKGRQPNP